MTIIHQPNELAARKVCLAIGVFDGVHLGHQQVLRQTITDAHQHGAVAVAITFDRHPNSVVAPARTPALIYAVSQKLRAIASLGIDSTFVIGFDRAFSQKPAEVFIRELPETSVRFTAFVWARASLSATGVAETWPCSRPWESN